MNAKASNTDGLNNIVSLHLHTNLHFEDQVKIAKLMSHSIFKDLPLLQIVANRPNAHNAKQNFILLLCYSFTVDCIPNRPVITA